MRTTLALTALLVLISPAARADERYAGKSYRETGYLRLVAAPVRTEVDLGRLRETVIRSTGLREVRITPITGQEAAEVVISANRQISTQNLSNAIRYAGFQIRSMENRNTASAGAESGASSSREGRARGEGYARDGMRDPGFSPERKRDPGVPREKDRDPGFSPEREREGSVKQKDPGFPREGDRDNFNPEKPRDPGNSGDRERDPGFDGRNREKGGEGDLVRTSLLAGPIRTEAEARRLTEAFRSLPKVRQVSLASDKSRPGVVRVQILSEGALPLELVDRAGRQLRVDLRLENAKSPGRERER